MRRFFVVSVLLVVAVGFWIYTKNNVGVRSDEGSAALRVSDSVDADHRPYARSPHSVLQEESVSGRTDRLDFYQLKFDAENGDPKAQRDLATVYGRCMAYSLSPQKYFDGLRAIAAQAPESAVQMERVIKKIATDCSEVDGGSAIPLDAYEAWIEQAAKSGDLVAKLRIAARSTDVVSPKEYQDLVAEALASREPEALFEAGQLLALAPGNVDLGEYGRVSATPYAAYAWAVVACRMGMDCGSDSYVMESVCTNYGSCNRGNYENFVRADLISVGDRRRFDDMVTVVSGLVKFGNQKK